ncbi:sialate O-acetylesterase [Enterobacter roggenkampii]|uniref:sialate O-acetylesterase n=1 Tax=Enterobacter roggenkampii TaxID=1812935 RepID=UPI00143317EE|nr:sialate O-acetylesterase [Enterobacter roggenkampii]
MKKPNENAIIFKDGKWVQVSPSSFEVKGFGPEVSFAHEVAKKEKIGIIKVSAGDTKLAEEWNSDQRAFFIRKHSLR